MASKFKKFAEDINGPQLFTRLDEVAAEMPKRRTSELMKPSVSFAGVNVNRNLFGLDGSS